MSTRSVRVIFCCLGLSLPTLHGDDGGLNKEMLANWESLSIGIVWCPGCTEPHTESVTLTLDPGSITHKVDKIGSRPESVTTIKVKIRAILVGKISDELLAYYKLAAAERSVPEQLESLAHDPEATAKLAQAHPPGIGGYSQTFLAITIKTGGKETRVTEEFAGSGMKFLAWLKSLPRLANRIENR